MNILSAGSNPLFCIRNFCGAVSLILIGEIDFIGTIPKLSDCDFCLKFVAKAKESDKIIPFLAKFINTKYGGICLTAVEEYREL